MRTLSSIIFVFASLLVLGYSWYQYLLTPCDKVLHYSIGRFDGNFGLSEQEFKNRIEEAETPWENFIGKNLFQSDPEAGFTVNLVYDERQRETLLRQRTESGLTAAEDFLKNLDQKLNTAKAQYEAQKTTYESVAAVYKKNSSSYEAEVRYWNSQKGAPPAEYRKLEKVRKSLNQEATALNAEMKELNQLVEVLNTAVTERNSAALSYNQAVKAYNQKYGGHSEFNQAEYTGREINIYQFGDPKNLVMALAHELGHALNMEHVENTRSIMYYLRQNDHVPSNPGLTEEDQAELNRVCKL